MITREEFMKKIRGADNPERFAEDYLLDCEKLWMSEHLRHAVNMAICEAWHGRQENLANLDDRFFLE